MPVSQGCILEQIDQFADLVPEEKALLLQLEKDPKRYAAQTCLCAAGEEAERFYTLRSGWACAVRDLADGRRQVLDIFLPGQILGLREMGFNEARSDFVALTDIEACPFPRRQLTEVFEQAPRLASLFFLILAREQSMLVERIINIGRRPAAERLAHFLLEMKVRLQRPSEEVRLPMNQSVLGDALGMSAVHVSRSFSQLRKRDLISTEDGAIRIKDMDGLVRFSGFNQAYLDCEANWVKSASLGCAEEAS
ncbi:MULTISPECIES: Crp/Fnr family transcriptional regulator [unclassified Thioalkalivibrio]|uniref:Crp/Fnr family transcriptional regulator n=1 Tax=unclassified Thioalkalivibrio TaxID=2621013 RepID=UPI00035ECCAD|nr:MULTISPECIES: Crp/Fnr family transcriptional regulator [unclassified Thioalkalivibrio]